MNDPTTTSFDRRRTERWTLCLATMALLACEGELESAKETRFVEPPPECTDVALPSASPQLLRLPHAQYDFVLEDLFGFTTGQARAFAPDPVIGGFDNNAEMLHVDARLFANYQTAAEETALAVLASPASYALVVPCAPTGDGQSCAREFIATFGRRAYKRPLSDGELERYVELFNAAVDFYAEGTTFERGVRAVLEAMLQSPYFLYRHELDETSEAVGEHELVRLSGYTLAGRLASTLWASIPDDELLDAAAAGALDTPEGLREQALRMVQSPKLVRVLDDFHAQWMGARDFGVEAKVPPLPEGAGDSMRAELRELVRYVAETDGTYRDLITAPYSFIDANLAPLYGLSDDFGAEPVMTSLDPALRAGILTQIGPLSSHAHAATTSPIHRGVFIMRKLLCLDVEPPNFAIDPTLPPRDENIVTTRDQVEHHTQDASCQSCHKTINALGFGLENYDASGSYRTEDNGAPVDASGRIALADATLAFENGVELASALADSGLGGRCYIDQWMGYSFGRAPTSEDRCASALIDREVAVGDHNVRDVLVGITTSVPFRYRLPNTEE